MIKCHAWEYNMTDNLGNTWSSEWNLVCDKKYLKIVAEMIFLIGVATGGIISGMLSDKFGRKKMLFISALFQSFFGKYLLVCELTYPVAVEPQFPHFLISPTPRLFQVLPSTSSSPSRSI